MAHAMTGVDDELADGHLAQAGREGHEGTQQRDEPPEEHDGLTPAGEPGVGPVEVLVGKQQVLAEFVDQGPAAVTPDAVAGQGAQDLAQHAGHDDQGQRQRLHAVGGRSRCAGEHAAEDQRQLGPDRQAHGRDEAEQEDRSVAHRGQEALEPAGVTRRCQKISHDLPCLRRLCGGHHWRADLPTQFAGHPSLGPGYRDVPPDVTTGWVVVVAGGLVVVVVGGLVVVVTGGLVVGVVVAAEPGELDPAFVVGAVVVVVVVVVLVVVDGPCPPSPEVPSSAQRKVRVPWRPPTTPGAPWPP